LEAWNRLIQFTLFRIGKFNSKVEPSPGINCVPSSKFHRICKKKKKTLPVRSRRGLWPFGKKKYVPWPRSILFVQIILWKPVYVSGVQSAGWLDIHFTAGISCERAASLAEKNAAVRHYVLRSLISLHNEHSVHLPCSTEWETDIPSDAYLTVNMPTMPNAVTSSTHLRLLFFFFFTTTRGGPRIILPQLGRSVTSVDEVKPVNLEKSLSPEPPACISFTENTKSYSFAYDQASVSCILHSYYGSAHIWTFLNWPHMEITTFWFQYVRWPRGLKHEMSSPARTLRSWILILLEVWMSVCVYSVCDVGGSGLATRWSPVQVVLPCIKR
jgi:hypothetical protein